MKTLLIVLLACSVVAGCSLPVDDSACAQLVDTQTVHVLWWCAESGADCCACRCAQQGLACDIHGDCTDREYAWAAEQPPATQDWCDSAREDTTRMDVWVDSIALHCQGDGEPPVIQPN